MNKEIEKLNNKIDAQDKIINEQVLEIANLKEDKETLVLTIKTILKDKEELKQKILELLNNKRNIMVNQMLYGISVDYKELLFQIDEEIRKILGKKE